MRSCTMGNLYDLIYDSIDFCVVLWYVIFLIHLEDYLSGLWLFWLFTEPNLFAYLLWILVRNSSPRQSSEGVIFESSSSCSIFFFLTIIESSMTMLWNSFECSIVRLSHFSSTSFNFCRQQHFLPKQWTWALGRLFLFLFGEFCGRKNKI